MTLFIAEISNMHEGSIDKAKELIRVAKESGADLVKSQAFVAHDMLQHGTMDYDFYLKCQFSYRQYIELIDYAKSIDIDFFYSIISPSHLMALSKYQKYQKITAGQFERRRRSVLVARDRPTTFISMRKVRSIPFKHAQLMYAEPYLDLINYNDYLKMTSFQGRPIGLSLHNKETEHIEALFDDFEIPVIEKHFFLGNEIKFKSKIYRDCLHASTPQEFENLARRVKK